MSSVVGSNISLVLIQLTFLADIGGSTVFAGFRPDGSTEEWVVGGSSSYTSITIISSTSAFPNALGLILTGENGIVEWKSPQPDATCSLSVLFYLN